MIAVRLGAALFASLIFSMLIFWTRGAAETSPEIWRDERGGQSRHLQSGFACPGQFIIDASGLNGHRKGLVNLETLVVGEQAAPSGEQVGCEYVGESGAWATVEIRKLNQGDSASDISAKTRRKIVAQFPSARRKDTIFNCKPTTVKFAHETFCMSFDHVESAQSVGVIVTAGGEVDGWAITLIHFVEGSDHAGLEFWVGSNWGRIATSRARQPER